VWFVRYSEGFFVTEVGNLWATQYNVSLKCIFGKSPYTEMRIPLDEIYIWSWRGGILMRVRSEVVGGPWGCTLLGITYYI